MPWVRNKRNTIIHAPAYLEERRTELILANQGRFCSQVHSEHTEEVDHPNHLESFFKLCITWLNIVEVLQDALLLQAASSGCSEVLSKDFSSSGDHLVAVQIPKPPLATHPGPKTPNTHGGCPVIFYHLPTWWVRQLMNFWKVIKKSSWHSQDVQHKDVHAAESSWNRQPQPSVSSQGTPAAQTPGTAQSWHMSCWVVQSVPRPWLAELAAWGCSNSPL